MIGIKERGNPEMKTPSSRDHAARRRGEVDAAMAAGKLPNLPNYNKAKASFEKLLEWFDRPIPKDRNEIEAELEACVFMAKDDSLIKLAIEFKENNMRWLGQYLNEVKPARRRIPK